MRISMRYFALVFICALLSTTWVEAQEGTIYLANPSFEDFPRQGKAPRNWYDCGFEGETPPDIQPSGNPSSAFFEVNQAAYEGNTYLGMVVRDNDTWEMVSQRLSAPLKAGVCYEFSVHASRSHSYVSQSRTTMEQANYATPARLRIWGGSGYCSRKELLAETGQIINTRWLQYDFRFEPQSTHTYIVIEAFYNTPTLFPYNGNVLVDNCSPIVLVPCEDEVIEPVASVDPPEPDPTPNPEPTPPKPDPTVTEPDPVVANPEPKEKLLKDLDRSKLKEGQTIRIDQLYFEADSAKFKQESYAVLDEIYGFLQENQDVVVEIGGHTNGNPPHDYCDRLSTARAQSVAEYLNQKGISWERLKYRGYGKRKPLASNATAQGRRKNQRVEIKILGFDG
jgi:outer membrane protein OmpA-like peptidoglycan-associated protein